MADLTIRIEPVAPEHARKRGVNKENWKKEKKRRELYSSKRFPSAPKCHHKNNKTFTCSTLKMQDIARMHRKFFKLKSKIDQDNFILQHCRFNKCVRTRLVDQSRGPKNLSVEYYVTIKNPHKNVRVCKNAFLEILTLGKDRVMGVIQRSFKDGGSIAKENRGGSHKIALYGDKQRNVQEFIESFQAAEPHYCRAKSSVRLYLPPELNIKKMWKLYQDTNHLQVKSYFRNIFNRKYNIGFGSPLKDTCSRCSELTRKIECASTSQDKQRLQTEKQVHTLKAKAFYNLLKTEPGDTILLSFDCHKNSALPKLPDQAAYFSRQFNMYNFTIVVGTSKSPLTTNNVHSYHWCENEHSKFSNEIASAVFHKLTTLDIPEIKTKLKLFADGCGGQNKNTTLVGMCTKWLSSHAPPQVKQIEIVFPMVGHSFLPPDRIFAKIEKETKKQSIICNPQDYVNVFKKHATVYHLGEEVEVYNWKDEVSKTIKPPGSWHFKFNPSKRFIISKGRQNVSIQGEENYRNEFNKPKYVTKRGKRCSEIEPAIIRKGNKVKLSKIKDVTNLLNKHYGEDWRTLDFLKYYKDIEETNENFEECEDLQCVPLEENENFI
ncbi:uncharacterized protein LOC106139404 isoform X1 [Amyelois transitella]|uniref:uncharacterized protein LOC106139404 isoform X1 n=1 Tax=Amyelois transitella TaxID=680683 RepID=UPI00067AA9C8|nr:uncharacterized protein LOC106139404 isoform X1 [Amyelois transitella]